MSKIVIDGNIGAGKTTQLNRIEKLGFRVVKEPIEQWPLDLFYSDPERWGFLFQMVILNTLQVQDGSCVYERCPLSSLQVFWKLMKKHPVEDITYQQFYKKHGWSPDVYIYISTPPEVCFERLKNRYQEGDTAVTLEYLKALDLCYRDMYRDMTCPKYMVDGTQPQNDIIKNILDIISNDDGPVPMEKL